MDLLLPAARCGGVSASSRWMASFIFPSFPFPRLLNGVSRGRIESFAAEQIYEAPCIRFAGKAIDDKLSIIAAHGARAGSSIQRSTRDEKSLSQFLGFLGGQRNVMRVFTIEPRLPWFVFTQRHGGMHLCLIRAASMRDIVAWGIPLLLAGRLCSRSSVKFKRKLRTF